MPVPGFQSMMLPVMEHLKKSKGMLNPAAIRKAVAHELKLSEEDLAEEVPSGVQTKFYNRISWILNHLKSAGWLVSPKRGKYQITEEGIRFLETNPKKIDLKLLRTIPIYREKELSYKNRDKKEKDQEGLEAVNADSDSEITPEELIGINLNKIKNALKAELLEQIKQSTKQSSEGFVFFERLVVDLLLEMSYGFSKKSGRLTQKTNDGGIDGIIDEDKLGISKIYIQAKRWDAQVGKPELQKFAGALDDKQTQKGVFITTSDFSQPALNYVESIQNKKSIVLIDGPKLVDLMIEYEVGVDTKATYKIRKIDTDYFEVE